MHSHTQGILPGRKVLERVARALLGFAQKVAVAPMVGPPSGAVLY